MQEGPIAGPLDRVVVALVGVPIARPTLRLGLPLACLGPDMGRPEGRLPPGPQCGPVLGFGFGRVEERGLGIVAKEPGR